ncbi:hypothetical protein CVS47_00055 [Microbacterium lemovicicum]|uniref:Gram-positive cocci surface proteins LPxTG domain-containing protein n=1 Tax=Microbacterium lemovicicum TaxID=1072463 RepID=A0A3Q9IXS9_9MICO|nr:LPXTG cell wall anchor domain-containing protein [Microbacterium lemovicicum]AZS35463.1 hypothetical protein CVS47_00055 [Microbacterium lemovicicum]
MAPNTAVRRTLARSVVALAAASVLAIAAATPASALPADELGVFPTWTVSGSAGAYTAAPDFAASAGSPAATLTSTATTVTTASGASAYLNAATAFGAEFGSTRLQPYVTLSAARGGGNSTTFLSFADSPPAGWGMALGDVDAEWIVVQAWADAAGTVPLPIADLGFRGAENYCGSSPRPGTCTTAPFTDAPVWVTAPEAFDGIDYVPGTLRGNSLPGAPAPSRDTSGAYGWFTPSAAVRAITLTLGVRDGAPTSQLWLAAPAPKVTVTGTVALADGTVPEGTAVQIEDAAGTPLLDLQGEPVVVPVDADSGAFTAELEESADGYQAQVLVPEGYAAPPPIAIPGEPEGDDGSIVLAPIVVEPVVDPSPEPSSPAPVPSSPAPVPSPSTPAPAPSSTATGIGGVTHLPDTGADGDQVLFAGLAGGVLLLAGIAAAIITRRRRTS